MTAPALELSGISAELGPHRVLCGVDLGVMAGEHVGLIGPNGAGKTSLLRVAAGLVAPSAGSVSYLGRPIAALSRPERARHRAYLAQSREMAWRLRVEDVVALGRYAWGGGPYRALGRVDRDAVDKALAQTGADRFVGREAVRLSGGEQARVHFARALAGQARLVLLDEPFAALDLGVQLDLLDVIDAACRTGTAVMSAVHDLDLATRHCRRLVLIDAGCLVSTGTPDKVLTPEILESVFGLARAPGGGFRRAAGNNTDAVSQGRASQRT